MNIVDLILAKRNGTEHSQSEINFIVDGVTHGTLPDYQLAAWMMAVYFSGMTVAETVFLTRALAHSGQILDLSSCGAVVGDKHSTGGVGDKTSLVLVPLLAAVGLPMALLSGRGLGHTGGTLDKLEAIPGYNRALTKEQFISQVGSIGAAISGQTAELAPADGKMYSLRDVTGTVESIPLIVASIVSKKLAAGTNLIVLDVKCGAGAVMETEAQARRLADAIVQVGEKLGKPISAAITDMEQPLGCAVGHTVEVIESIEALKGNGPPDLMEVCFTLGCLALVSAGVAKDDADARRQMTSAISDGRALEKFRQLVKAHGGDVRAVDDYSVMPTARLKVSVQAAFDGQRFVAKLNGRAVAQACALMGAGRRCKSDVINLAVGVVLHAKVGAAVQGGQTIATIYADTQSNADEARALLEQAYTFSERPVAAPQVVRAIMPATKAAVMRGQPVASLANHKH